jgi:uncharacterized protein YggL (DUF469 family)
MGWMTKEELRDALEQREIPSKLVEMIAYTKRAALRVELRRRKLSLDEFAEQFRYLAGLEFKEGMKEEALREGFQAIVEKYASYLRHYKSPIKAFGELRLDVEREVLRAKGYVKAEEAAKPCMKPT